MSFKSKYATALVQMSCSPNPAENLQKAVARVEEAAATGAEVVCLPEMFQSQYFCQSEDQKWFDLAETVPGPATSALGKVAKAKGVVIVAPLFERRTPGIYHNSAAVIDTSGEVVGLYRKMHIPDDPGYYEKFYFTPGDLGFPAVDTKVARISTMICWDQWYPEAARIAALHGPSILFFPTAIGWHPSEKDSVGNQQHDAWKTIQRSHAIASGVYVAAVNRIGFEKTAASGAGLEFWGSSFICDPFGVVLAEGSADREEILLAEIDLKRIEHVRRHWHFLRDRRIDAYGGITQRFLDEESWLRKT